MNEQLQTLQRHDEAVTALAPAITGGIEVAQSRVAQEVQAAMVVAKKFPRNQAEALARIEQACCRPGLAAKSQYHYPRGGQEISGPTIRLAEVLAQGWGNIDYGTIEIEQRDGESMMMAYCWDLETNLRSTMMFVVPHTREKKGRDGMEQIALDGARDVYEVTANMAARRKRSCILNVIPVDVQEEAIELCNKTLAADFTEEKRDKMIEAFQTVFSVTQEQLEIFIGRRAKKFDGGTYVRLRRIYATLKDGFASVQDFFPPPANTEGKPRSKFGFQQGDKGIEPVDEPDVHPEDGKDTVPGTEPEVQESPTMEADVPEGDNQSDNEILDQALVDDTPATVGADDQQEKAFLFHCNECEANFDNATVKKVRGKPTNFCKCGSSNLDSGEDWRARESTEPEATVGVWLCENGHDFPEPDGDACPTCGSKSIEQVEQVSA